MKYILITGTPGYRYLSSGGIIFRIAGGGGYFSSLEGGEGTFVPSGQIGIGYGFLATQIPLKPQHLFSWDYSGSLNRGTV
ncbi:MAG: hypothetical protein U9P42_04505 [Candidatus Fermentibacteria bacterium]|nr:hypothetical protein [Candidatus Fermentibacteria bacterium]